MCDACPSTEFDGKFNQESYDVLLVLRDEALESWKAASDAVPLDNANLILRDLYRQVYDQLFEAVRKLEPLYAD